MSLCPKCRTKVDSSARFCPSCGQPVASTSLTFGDYQTTALIGEGGMGRVYKAVQRKLNRSVCIKTLLPQYATDQAIARRFEREATTIASLVHPNIVSVFDVGITPDGLPYIVMEFVDGRPLRSILRDESPVPFERAARIIDQVLSALGEAHTRSIIHRDLKPANVMVTALLDSTELCKVLDFGIAKTMDEVVEEKLTGAGMVLGTPGYMAPEQLSGEPYDHRIDLYAAGVMLYELLTGQRVFRVPNETELMKKTLLETPDPPSTRTTQQVPVSLDVVCLKALARNPKDRYSNAGEFRDALAQAIRTSSGASAIFSVPSMEYTPLAVAIDTRDASTNSRALLSAVLGSADEWERAHLVSQFERSLNEQLLQENFTAVKATINSLHTELKEKGQSIGVKLLIEATRSVVLAALPLLLGWLADETKRASAQWLLRLLGRATVPTYLQELPKLEPSVQQHLLAVVRLLDPELKQLLASFKGASVQLIKPVLISSRDWPDEVCAQVFASVMQSTDPVVRQAALECLDERTAFRLGTAVRQRLHDPVPAVRAEALKWVTRLQDDTAVPDLLKLLERSTVAPVERRAVWRVLGALKTDAAVSGLIWAIKAAQDVEIIAELSLLLVRSRSPRGIAHVRAMAQASGTQFKVKRVLEEALREA